MTYPCVRWPACWDDNSIRDKSAPPSLQRPACWIRELTLVVAAGEAPAVPRRLEGEVACGRVECEATCDEALGNPGVCALQLLRAGAQLAACHESHDATSRGSVRGRRGRAGGGGACGATGGGCLRHGWARRRLNGCGEEDRIGLVSEAPYPICEPCRHRRTWVGDRVGLIEGRRVGANDGESKGAMVVGAWTGVSSRCETSVSA